MSLDAYEFICQGIPAVRKALLDPYYLCFQDVTRAAAVSLIGYSIDHIDNWEEFKKNERVAMVYAYQKQFGAIASPEVRHGKTWEERRAYGTRLGMRIHTSGDGWDRTHPIPRTI